MLSQLAAQSHQRTRATKGSCFHHRNVSGVRADNLPGVFCPSDALIGRDAHRQSESIGYAADLGEFSDGGAGLLQIVQRTVPSQCGGRFGCLCDRPIAIGIAAHCHVGAGCSNGLDPSDVLSQACLPRHFDLHSPTTGIAVKKLRNLTCLNGWNSSVDLDCFP